MFTRAPASSACDNAESRQSPQITRCGPINHRSADRVSGLDRGFRNEILRFLGSRRILANREDRIHFLLAEAHHPKVESICLDFPQLCSQQRLVPSSVQRQFIVGDDVSPTLGLAQVIQHHHWHLRETQLARRQETPVLGDYNPGAGVHQDWIQKAEFGDASCDLRNLLRRVVRAFRW